MRKKKTCRAHTFLKQKLKLKDRHLTLLEKSKFPSTVALRNIWLVPHKPIITCYTSYMYGGALHPYMYACMYFFRQISTCTHAKGVQPHV